MDRRVLLLCIGFCSTVGGYVPTLFGQGDFSPAAIVGSAVGALAGIWLAAKVSA